MKKKIVFGATLAALVMGCFIASAQLCFSRKNILVSITGGSGRAVYSTRDGENLIHRDCIKGTIDPLIVEYGISDRFGIGFSSGGENYSLNANKFYGYGPDDINSELVSISKYFTLDLSYHLYVSKRCDVSVFSGAGKYRIQLSDYDALSNGYSAFDYRASGAIIRTGIRARYYFWGRLGVMGMICGYSGVTTPKKTNEVSDQPRSVSNYSTLLTGYGREIGLCLRLGKKKPIIKDEETE